MPRMTRVDAARELLSRKKARRSLLDFIKYCWWMPQRFMIGKHTKAIADRITQAVNDLKQGKSTFLLIAVPFRHGKTDLVSRALPAWFLGYMRDSEPDVIMSGYGATLVQGFSKRVKGIIRGGKYQALFPGVLPGHGTNSAAEWQIADSAGVVTATGLGGSLTGKGGTLIVVDDYCKSRAEARSQTYRDKVWDAFTNDLLTRRAPASIVIVCATPWHVDDIRGRILQRMAKDPAFPQFEELNFAAKITGSNKYLFPERFDDAWYVSQYATLGKLASGLLDCNPEVEGGNRFQVDKVVVHKDLIDWPTGKESRGWDLASSTKERDSDDPDWTVGVRGMVKTERVTDVGPGAKRYHIWVRHIAYIQAEAPQRDALIRATAIEDGPGVAQVIEAFGGYKDAYTTLRSLLSGISVVKKSRLPGDKSAKLAPLEPSFEHGVVHIMDGPWLKDWTKQFAEFPDGTHDDFADATGVMFHEQIKGGSGMLV